VSGERRVRRRSDQHVCVLSHRGGLLAEAAFAEFQAAAIEQDLDDAYVELDHCLTFGAFQQNRLVAAASMYPWDERQGAASRPARNPGPQIARTRESATARRPS
jgi:hypothetical protein